MDQTLVNRIVEAALLAASQPLTLAQLHGLFPEEEPAPAGMVERALEELREGCTDRGVELVEVASGFRYQVKADVHGWVARLWTERKTKYSRATLETLALIAYRQPITRGEIEQVRGVAVSSNIIQALEEREWIRVVGHRDVPGKPALFGTTKVFLDYFGLKRLDELPPLSELRDIGELEPQLPLDDAPLPAGIAQMAGSTAGEIAEENTGDASEHAEGIDHIADEQDGNDETQGNDAQEISASDEDTEADATSADQDNGAELTAEETADIAMEGQSDDDNHDDLADGEGIDSHPNEDDDAERLDEGQVSSEQKQ